MDGIIIHWFHFFQKKKTSTEIAQSVIHKLSEDGLLVEDYPGQVYDNKATMAGIHCGVKQQIRNVSSKAMVNMLIPCAMIP